MIRCPDFKAYKMSIESLNILVVVDSSEDVEKILRVLDEGGICCDCLCISTVNELHAALVDQSWDVILSSYSLKQIDAKEVLSVLATYHLNTPFIILSSHAGEEVAGTLMDLGAHDFVMKANMARLVPAIRRSIKEVKNFLRFNETQAALQKSETRFRAITANLPSVVFQFLLDEEGELSFPYVSGGSVTLLGLTPQVLMDSPTLFLELILPEDKSIFDQLMMTSVVQLTMWNWEGRIQVKGYADMKWISLRATPRRTGSGATLWDGIMINITRNKLAEYEIARSREQLAELSSYLQKIKEHERAHIAREIHDDIGGTLTAIKFELQPCLEETPRLPVFYQKKAKSVEALVDRVIDSTRRISLDLRPSILDCGIVAAIQWQTKEFTDRTGIPCHVSCDTDDIPLDADLSVAIFRIFQETLTNISKHAQAEHIQVKLEEVDGLVFLEVIDDGCGIKMADIKKQESFGIRGMRERSQQLKGNFDVSAMPDKGTKVTICIPINEVKNYTAQMNNASDTLKELSSPKSDHVMKTKVS